MRSYNIGGITNFRLNSVGKNVDFSSNFKPSQFPTAHSTTHLLVYTLHKCRSEEERLRQVRPSSSLVSSILNDTSVSEASRPQNMSQGSKYHCCNLPLVTCQPSVLASGDFDDSEDERMSLIQLPLA